MIAQDTFTERNFVGRALRLAGRALSIHTNACKRGACPAALES